MRAGFIRASFVTQPKSFLKNQEIRPSPIPANAPVLVAFDPPHAVGFDTGMTAHRNHSQSRIFPAFAVIAFPRDAPESLARKGRWCDMPAGERASESTTAVSVCDPSWRPHQRSGKKRMPEFREAQKRISLRRLREGGVARHRREGFLMKPVVELRANASNSPSSSAANARSSLAFDLKNTINIDKFLKTIDQIIIPYSILFQLLTRLS